MSDEKCKCARCFLNDLCEFTDEYNRRLTKKDKFTYLSEDQELIEFAEKLIISGLLTDTSVIFGYVLHVVMRRTDLEAGVKFFKKAISNMQARD